MSTQPLQQNIIDELKRRYEQGASLRELAREHRMSHESVRRRLISAGVSMRPRGEPRAYALSEATYEQLRKEYEGGSTIAEMASKWAVSRDALRSALARAEVKMRPPGRRRSVAPDEQYGRLTVKSYDRDKGRWLCRCVCGEQSYVTSNALTTGRQVSCGCYLMERRTS